MFLPDFGNLRASTVTISVETNLNFDLNSIVKQLLDKPTSINDEVAQRTHQILSSKVEVPIDVYKLLTNPAGTVSYLKFSNVWYGVRRRGMGLSKTTTKTRVSKNDFINQATLVVYVYQNVKINAMLFQNGKIKMAGCKSENDALFVLHTLVRIAGRAATMVVNPLFSTINVPVRGDPMFVMANEMINVTFSFPDTIDKLEVNRLFQSLPVEQCNSNYEQTSKQYVNIKLFSPQQNSRTVLVGSLVLPGRLYLRTIPFRMINSKKHPSTCFMVFPERVVMSGCGIDYTIMQRHYEIFNSVLERHLDCIMLL